MPPKAFEVGALRAKNLILWFSPIMLTPALLSLSLHLLWSLPPSLPPIPQFNFSSLSLNSNQSKPLQIQWFISRLASSVTTGHVPGPASCTFWPFYLSVRLVSLTQMEIPIDWVTRCWGFLEADEGKKKKKGKTSTAERTDKQTAKRMFAQTNGCPAGLMNGHVERVEVGERCRNSSTCFPSEPQGPAM